MWYCRHFLIGFMTLDDQFESNEKNETKNKIKHLLTTFSFFITWQFTTFYSIYQHIEIQTRMEIFSSKFISKMKNRSHLS